ncbi:MAG: acyltransferase family protein [Crocinitomicaceae bacterium]
MASQNNINIKKPYFENLDALRFLAAFAVFAFHFFKEANGIFLFNEGSFSFKAANLILSKGALGVNFFFVLSGFLITYLILSERKSTGHFNLKHFLIRRTLRIWPLYFLIVFIGFTLFPFLFNDYSTSHSPLYYLFFLANFDEIRVGLSDSINFLTAPWSVAVEEQFYLFWGIVLLILHKMKAFNLWIVLAILLIISLIFSFFNYSSDRVLYYHTLSVMANIVIGSALALAYFQKKDWLMTLKNLEKWKIISVYIAGIIMILAKNKLFSGHLVIAEQTCISLFFAFIIFDQVCLSNSFYKIGNVKFFTHLGKISYGIYLFHLVIMFVFLTIIQDLLLFLGPIFGTLFYLIVAALGTYFISYFSFQFFEKPFLQLKSKFQ